MLAVKEGRDELAKQALMRQGEHAERAAALETTWQAQASETEKLKGSLRQLNDKIEEAKRKRKSPGRQAAAGPGAEADPRDHVRSLQHVRFRCLQPDGEKIEEQERQSLAAVEVTEALGPGTLEEEFKVLESGGGTGDVEDRLLGPQARDGLDRRTRVRGSQAVGVGRRG